MRCLTASTTAEVRKRPSNIPINEAMAQSKDFENQRPDLEERTNVVEAHASLMTSGAAQSRERRLKETGMEPVSLWVFLGSAFVLLVGGAVLGAGGKLFNYDPYPVGYVRPEFASDADSGPTIGPILEALMKRGKNIYTKCSGCHGSNGAGDGGNRPPLANSEWVTGSPERLAMIILNGVKGPIVVDGKSYGADVMDGQGPLTADELAGIMTYVRNSFGNDVGDVVTPEQASEAIKISNARAGAHMSADELNANHDKALEGETIDPNTPVNFETLKPAEASGE